MIPVRGKDRYFIVEKIYIFCNSSTGKKKLSSPGVALAAQIQRFHFFVDKSFGQCGLLAFTSKLRLITYGQLSCVPPP